MLRVPWSNSTCYAFSRASVMLHVPERSGVYVVQSETTWIYVGEGENIRALLLEHLDGDNPCITVFPGLTFSYELVARAARTWRQNELVSEFRPLCNPWRR
jgi:hypothetical protein